VRVRVVATGSTAGRVRTIPTISHVPAAADGMTVVVRSRTTTPCVRVVGLGLHHSVAADMAVLVVGVVTAAVRTATVVLGFQLAIATDGPISVVDFTITAAMRGPAVDFIPTAGAVCAVFQGADLLVRTTELRGGIIRIPSATGRLVRRQWMKTATTPVVSLVVDGAVTASCVVVELAFKNTVVGRIVRRRRLDF